MKAKKIVLIMLSLVFFGVIITGQSFAQIDPKTLVGAWLLDEDGGNVAKDASGNGNDGDIQGNPESVDGKFGKALEFSGTNGIEIRNPEKFEFLTWTYVLWFRAKAGGDYPNLIGRQFANTQGWTIHLDPGGTTFRIRIDTDGGVNQVKTVPKLVRDEEWHHGAITHDEKSKKLQMYIDGAKGDLTYAGEYKNSGGFLKIAFAAVGAVNLREAAIDDVGIFNVLLEEDDILEIMNKGLESAVGLLAVSPSGRLTTTWGKIKDNN